jgi:hypothetical protein
VNAGFFDGNVAIMGQLLVRGVPIGPELAQQITFLQQQLAILDGRIAALEARIAASGGG